MVFNFTEKAQEKTCRTASSSASNREKSAWWSMMEGAQKYNRGKCPPKPREAQQ